MQAEQAFARETRRRSRAALVRRTLRRCLECTRLAIAPDRADARGAGRLRDIPLEAIGATVEPTRASRFDAEFRPARSQRCRWTSLWAAMQEGAALPPIHVVAVGCCFAVLDGHHRVSVAKARGADTITAIVT
jgi:hypothetical protein